MRENPWALQEHQYLEERLARSESLFSLGNGYLGFRGFFCEREPAHHSAVFINGFYEISPIHYGEDAYGFARFNQTMVDLPDCRYLRISVDGEFFSLSGEGVQKYYRELDFKRGILTQKVTWATQSGKEVDIIWETLISMVDLHTGSLHVRVECSAQALIEFYSSIALPAQRPHTTLDPRTGTILSSDSLIRLESGYNQDGFQATFKTRESGLYLACGALHKGSKEMEVEERVDQLPALNYSLETDKVDFYKCFYYHTSGRPNEQLPLDEVREGRIKGECASWEQLKKLQEEYLAKFWAKADIQIEGDAKLQKALRFNLFQLHQSTGRDGNSFLAAKGLTGSGYEGHYFWDTEIYGMPFFTHTDPQTARSLLRYRISLLDHARSRARKLSQRGALFPWRTINGLEASAYFPASTAQYHINGDIAYSIFQYLDVTGDYTILEEGGAELLFETARLWVDLGHYNPRKGGQFCLDEVTGPDEYSALVHNNLYTNVLAKYHLERVVELARYLKKEKSPFWDELVEEIELKEAELEEFAKAAKLMFIPFDEELGINPQDDQFLERQEWDPQRRGPIHHPMLLNYHPLVIYRHRVIKQADAILAMFLLGHYFPWHLRRRNFNFYEPYTTGDSSLSACIQGIVALECGYGELGADYIRQTALMDIEDLKRNTKDGLHTAAMAGSWLALVYGVAGYRLNDLVPTFRPHLPQGWSRLTFSLQFGEVSLRIEIGEKETSYRAQGGEIEILHRSERVKVNSSGVKLATKARCRAVIFDLDGVVTSTDEYHYQAWKKLADQEGWAFDREVNQRLRGVSRLESLNIILDHNRVALSEEEKFKLAETKNQWYRQSLESLSRSDILPGIGKLLEELRERGVKLAIASASQSAPYIVEKLGLSGEFDLIVPAHEVLKGKPDPEIFTTAAQMLGLYPEECTGIEDAPAGIEALREAMMRIVGVGSAVDPNLCDVYVEDTNQLRWEELLF